jgi:hypothetical protein
VGGKSHVISKTNPKLPPHSELEDYLGRYAGLMLFVKEIEDQRYQQICAVRPVHIHGWPDVLLTDDGPVLFYYHERTLS